MRGREHNHCEGSRHMAHAAGSTPMAEPSWARQVSRKVGKTMPQPVRAVHTLSPTRERNLHRIHMDDIDEEFASPVDRFTPTIIFAASSGEEGRNRRGRCVGRPRLRRSSRRPRRSRPPGPAGCRQRQARPADPTVRRGQCRPALYTSCIRVVFSSERDINCRVHINQTCIVFEINSAGWACERLRVMRRRVAPPAGSSACCPRCRCRRTAPAGRAPGRGR